MGKMTWRYYSLWAPVYDWIAGPPFRRFRRQAVSELGLPPGARLLISGVGTGLDFEFLPRGVEVIGVDMNETMLDRARRRARDLGLNVRLEIGDAESLTFSDRSFDAAYLPCIVCVAEDGGKALREALRVTKPGGRVVVIDKFLREGESPGLMRRALDRVSAPFVTHITRRWSEIAAGASGFTLLAENEGPFGGFFRMFVLRAD